MCSNLGSLGDPSKLINLLVEPATEEDFKNNRTLQTLRLQAMRKNPQWLESLKSKFCFPHLEAFQNTHISRDISNYPVIVQTEISRSVKDRTRQILELAKGNPIILQKTLESFLHEKNFLDLMTKLLQIETRKDILKAELLQNSSPKKIDTVTMLESGEIYTTEGFAFTLRFSRLFGSLGRLYHTTAADRPTLKNLEQHGNEEVRRLAKLSLMYLNYQEVVDEYHLIRMHWATICKLHDVWISNFSQQKILCFATPTFSHMLSLFVHHIRLGLKIDTATEKNVDLNRIEETTKSSCRQIYNIYKESILIQVELYKELYDALKSLGSGKIAFFKQYVQPLKTPPAFTEFYGLKTSKPIDSLAIAKDDRKKASIKSKAKGKNQKKKTIKESQPRSSLSREANTSDITCARIEVRPELTVKEEKKEVRTISTTESDSSTTVPPSVTTKIITATSTDTPLISDFPYKYARRVKRWFHLKPGQEIPFHDYTTIQDKRYLELTRIRHAFSKQVDGLLFQRNFCHWQNTIVSDKKRLACHLIAQFQYYDYPDVIDRGIITYSMENDVCIHRFFSLSSSSELINGKLEDIFSRIEIPTDILEETEDSCEESLSPSEDTITKNELYNFFQVIDKTNRMTITIFSIQSKI